MARDPLSNRNHASPRGIASNRRNISYRLSVEGDFWPSDIIAFWDFSESAAPFYAKKYTGSTAYPLYNAGASNVTKTAGGTFGSSVVFNGSNQCLRIPAASMGDLNIAQFGNEVTVLAWFQPSVVQTGFIGGVWDETNGNGKRQYGLFYNLPAFGGDTRVCGHISSNGGPTPGQSFNKDYAASARWLEVGYTKFIGMVYDGNEIKTHIDGVHDNKLSSNTNPYPYTLGLNRITAPANFTVGASNSGSMINFLKGRLSGLAIFKRALTSEEIMYIHLSTKPETMPILNFTFYSSTSSTDTPSLVGWSAALGTNAIDTSMTSATNFGVAVSSGNYFLFRNNTDGGQPSIGYFPTIDGLVAGDIQRVTFSLNNSSTSDSMRLVVRIGGNWYATHDTFSVISTHSAGDWSKAEKQQFDFSFSASKWHDLTFVSGGTLSLASSARTTDIIDGAIQAIGFYVGSVSGTVRVDNLSIY